MNRWLIFIIGIFTGSFINWNVSAQTYILNNRSERADTYYSSRGFDKDGNGQIDWIKTGNEMQMSIEVPGMAGIYLESEVGGIVAPQAYYPEAAKVETDAGWRGANTNLLGLIGNGTVEQPQLDSALGFRTVLYAQQGVNALRAWYSSAAQAFPPKLGEILEAEERFRIALRVNPLYSDALNGLLECYYARAEGFMLIGNDNLANAYSVKFNRKQNDTQSIVDMEVDNIEKALTCYDIGFQEFFKIFNTDFVSVGDRSIPSLNIDADDMFFKKSYPNSGKYVSFESLRGLKYGGIGLNSRILSADGNEIVPLQGSPNLPLEISQVSAKVAGRNKNSSSTPSAVHQMALEESRRQVKQLSLVSAPAKFLPPVQTSSSELKAGNGLTVRFELQSSIPVKTVEMMVEFTNEKLEPPTSIDKIKLSQSKFPIAEYYPPGGYYNGKQIQPNQFLLVLNSPSAIQGEKMVLAEVPFQVKANSVGSMNIYVTG